jgi:hypothetical protein
LTEVQKQAESVVHAACGCPLDWTGFTLLLEKMPFLKSDYQCAIQELVRLAALSRSAPRPPDAGIQLPPESRGLVTRAFGTFKPTPLPPVPAPLRAPPPIICVDSEEETAAVGTGKAPVPAGVSAAAPSMPIATLAASLLASPPTAVAAAVAASTAATPDPSSSLAASTYAAHLLAAQSHADPTAPRPAALTLPAALPATLLAALPLAPAALALALATLVGLLVTLASLVRLLVTRRATRHVTGHLYLMLRL